jgi:hypothetical protein
MLDKSTDGRLQVTAALSLLEKSGLVRWSPEEAKFEPAEPDDFDCYWRGIDPVFGRLMCWMQFSAGAEFLAKGVCLVREVDVQTEQDVPVYPTTDIDRWVRDFRKGETRTVRVTDYGAIGNLYNDVWNKKRKIRAELPGLCASVGATREMKELLLAAYELLGRSIRNRDAHAYVPKVRDSHFDLVPQLFSRCFNLLVSWLPGGAVTLNGWRAEAEEFIASLST